MYKPSRSLRQSQERFYTYCKPSPQGRAISFASGIENNSKLFFKESDAEKLQKEKINAFEAELSEQKEIQTQLKNELNDLRVKNKQQQQIIENFEFKLSIEKKDSLIYQQQVLRLEEQYNYQQDSVSTQKQQIKVLEGTIEHLEYKYKLNQEIVEQQISNKDCEIKLLQQEIKKYSDEIMQIRKQLIGQNSSSNDNEFIQALEQKFDLIQKEFIYYKKEKEQEIYTFQRTIEVDQSKITILEQENKQLREKQGNSAQDDIQQQLLSVKIELESQFQIVKQLNQQITILQQQLNQTNVICQNLKEEKQSAVKEKQAIETYYLDQLQKQDLQLSQMVKSQVQNEQKTQIQKLQIIIEQKDLMIRELSMQNDCTCNKKLKNDQKLIIRDLEKKNATLVMEVERLNKILKQKLTELENQSSRSCEENHKKYIEEIEIWKNKFLSINKQYHISQEQLMVVKTELDSLKKNKQKENIDPVAFIKS